MKEIVCGQCGDCCYPIVIDRDKKEITDKFILKHWHRISKEKATKLRKGAELYNGNGYRFYICDLFDVETRKCLNHDGRCSICKEYPHCVMRTNEIYQNDATPRCAFNGATLIAILKEKL